VLLPGASNPDVWPQTWSSGAEMREAFCVPIADGGFEILWITKDSQSVHSAGIRGFH
jgi:hypothetical protein